MTTEHERAAFEQLVRVQAPEIRSVHDRLHALIHETVPQATESVDLPDRVLAFGRGREIRGLWLALIAHKAWVNVQFPDGAALDDPAGIVESVGELVPEPRRPFDVGEQKRDGARR